MPQTGWSFLSSDDLGDLSGNCELCDRDLRHIYLISHPLWGFMSVGSDCSDRLTGTDTASSLLNETANRNERRKTFMSSSRWKAHPSGSVSIKQNGRIVHVMPHEGKFRTVVGDVGGKASYDTMFDAKLRIFEFFDSGEAAEFFAKRRKAKAANAAATASRVVKKPASLR